MQSGHDDNLLIRHRNRIFRIGWMRSIRYQGIFLTLHLDKFIFKDN